MAGVMLRSWRLSRGWRHARLVWERWVFNLEYIAVSSLKSWPTQELRGISSVARSALGRVGSEGEGLRPPPPLTDPWEKPPGYAPDRGLRSGAGVRQAFCSPPSGGS